MSAGDELIQALGRFGEILQRADSACAEMVEINENANDGSNAPACPCRSADHLQMTRWPHGWDIVSLWRGGHA